MIGPELYPIPPIRGGAGELWIEKVSHAFKEYQPFVFSPADPDLPAREKNQRVQYFRIPVLRFKRTFYSWFKAYLADYEKRITPILKEINPEIIHIHNRPLLVSYFRTRFPQKKIILHMHNLYNYLGRLEKPHGRFEIPSDLFLGCSRFVVEGERKRLARGSLRQAVLYNGVDHQAFLPSWLNKPEAQRIRQYYNLQNKKVILYTGKIRESKGVGLLVTAMKQVFREDTRAVLVLAGGTGFGYKRADKKTDFSEHLRREIESCRDRVLLLGFSPPQEMPRIYLLGDVFTAPSQLEEGLGMVFLEASACGLPILSTQQGGIPEVVIHEKTGLLLAQKDDATELAEKILYLLEHPEYGRELGEKGRQRVVENFSWTKIAESTEGLYNSFF